MEKIQDLVSIRDNGLYVPINHLRVALPKDMSAENWEKFFGENGKGIGYQWLYKGEQQRILWDQMPYKVFDLLADETGFLVLPEVYRSAEAKILNGDLSVRCAMYPRFNVRGFSDERLEEVKKANIIRYGDWTPTPHFKQQSRANTKRTDGIIEIEGNDGIADCLFFYDVRTGEFVGAKPFTWCD